VRWAWDERKNRTNRTKHGLSFETAVLVFQDTMHVSVPDPNESEGRWRTIGQVNGVCLFVVHTWPDQAAGTARIISARRATARERTSYEEGDFG
jgi:uncharacterized DUF497 family protein